LQREVKAKDARIDEVSMKLNEKRTPLKGHMDKETQERIDKLSSLVIEIGAERDKLLG
jgi:hypothetical protein